MVFSSLRFLFFLFLCLVVQGFCPLTRKKNLALLVFSLIFYLWGGVLGLAVLVVTSLANWFLALRLEEQRGGTRRTLLGLNVAVNVLAFCALRFWVNLPWSGEGTLAGRYLIPMGFAFYSLQLLSYQVDVYRGQVRAERSFSTLLLYSSLFAQSAGGPIVRYGEIQKSLRARKLKGSMASRGIMRFSCGLAKKLLLADSCGAVVSSLLGQDVDALAAAPVLAIWLGSIFFMLQIFLELSAYADMAIGLGLLLGFRFPENFDFPYVAESLRDFWAGWNKTVVAFFRDYVYTPLVGEGEKSRLSPVNLLIAGLLFGFWCGSGANMMLWAAYCVILLLAEERLLAQRLATAHAALRHLWVLGTMLLGFVLFRYSDLGRLAVALKGLVGLNGAGLATAEVGSLLFSHLPLLVLSVLACTPLTRMLGALLKARGKQDMTWLRVQAVVQALCPVALLLLSVMAMVGNQTVGFAFFQL